MEVSHSMACEDSSSSHKYVGGVHEDSHPNSLTGYHPMKKLNGNSSCPPNNTMLEHSLTEGTTTNTSQKTLLNPGDRGKLQSVPSNNSHEPKDDDYHFDKVISCEPEKESIVSSDTAAASSCVDVAAANSKENTSMESEDNVAKDFASEFVQKRRLDITQNENEAKESFKSDPEAASPFLYLPAKEHLETPKEKLKDEQSSNNIVDKPKVNGYSSSDNIKSEIVNGDVQLQSDRTKSPDSDSGGMRECSVKLVDFKKDSDSAASSPKRELSPSLENEVLQDGEPFSKKHKPNEQQMIAKERNLPSNLTIMPSSKDKAAITKVDNGKLTISPVRPKDATKTLADSSRPGGSVTITKLSTGTSQCVESKDLKNILGNNSNSNPEASSPVKKKMSPNSYLVEKSKKSSNKQQQQQNGKTSPDLIDNNSNSNRGIISCNKCGGDFSTKEAKKLHTCHSILDQRYLTEAGVRTRRRAPVEKPPTTFSSPLSSLSCGSSRSNSPLNHSSSVNGDCKTHLNEKQAQLQAANNQSSMVKLIKDDKDSLIIGGRPKLTVSKVNHKTTEVKVGTSSTTGEKKIVAKLKLSPKDTVENKTGAGVAVSSPHGLFNKRESDPLNLLGESDNGDNTHSVKMSDETSTSCKLKIKLPPYHPTSSSPSFANMNSNSGLQFPPGVNSTKTGFSNNIDPTSNTTSSLSAPIVTPYNNLNSGKREDDFAFTFAGKPTYSPSRVEPSATVPGKESPRDASNKDSPASQADSGVFSIASSSSPSKDGTNSGTSPDSPNRERMTYPDPAYNRDTQWKMTQNHNHIASKPMVSSLQQQQSFSSSSASSSSMSLPSSTSQMSYTSSQQQQGPNYLMSPSQQQQPHDVQSMSPMFPQSQQHLYGQQQQHLYQQQQKYLEQQQMQHKIPQASGQQRLPHVGGAPSGGPVANPQASQGGIVGALNTQQQAQRQYSFSAGSFFNEGSEPAVKRKGGRPRKNPPREPGAKRQYVRKKKSMPALPAGNDNSVYNFDEEEIQDDGLQPMRPRGAPNIPVGAKKYSFGSSSDEDSVRRVPGMFGYPPQAQHYAAMQRHHQMQQQQQQPQMYMNHNGSGMPGGGPINQQQQLPNEEDCRYESEPINKGSSIGIKIKIKRPAEPEKKKTLIVKEESPNVMPESFNMQRSNPMFSPQEQQSNQNNQNMVNQSRDAMQQHQILQQRQQQRQGQDQPMEGPANFNGQGPQSEQHTPHMSGNGMSPNIPNSMRGGVSYNGMVGNPNFPQSSAGPVHRPGMLSNMYGNPLAQQQQNFGYVNQGRYRVPFNNMQQSESGIYYNQQQQGNFMPQQYGQQQRYGANMMGSNQGFYGNQQQFMQHQQQQQQFGGTGEHFQNMYGGNQNQYNMYNQLQQQRMMNSNGDQTSQPIPSQFRPQHGLVGMGGGASMEGGNNSPNHRMISPSPRHNSVVGMPQASPQQQMLGGGGGSGVPRQLTPLVSPQSDHSPSHQTPHTPNNMHHHGPLTPQSNFSQNPVTPVSNMGYTGHPSPLTPVAQNNPQTPHSVGSYHQKLPVQPMISPKPESMLSPPPVSDSLRSPVASMMSPSSSNDLRKIRRPSRPDVPAEESPKQEPAAAPPAPAPPAPAPPIAAVAPKQTPPKPKVFPPKQFKERPSSFKEEPALPKAEKPEMIEMPHFEPRWDELKEATIHRILSFAVANEGSVPLLVRASRVSKTWNEATKPKDGRRNLWSHLDLSAGRLKEKYRNDKKLEVFLKRFDKVLEIKLAGWKNSVGPTTLKIVATACPNLISLGLASCFKLSNEDLKFIGENFPKLERLDLSNVSSSSCSSRSAVSSTCLSEFIATLGPRLTHLNISNNKMAGLPFVFKALSAHGSNIEELDISNITTTTRDPIYINMEKFQKGCPKLRVLNCNHTMISLSETPIKEQVHSPGFPLLEELHIAVDSRGYFEGMDDGQIERVLKKSIKLRLLDVRGCQHVTDSCLIRLPTWDIQKLILSGCSAASSSQDGVELMVKKWAQHLMELDVSGTSGERTINYAVEAFIDADETKIRKLNLCRTAVSIKPLTNLLKKCPTLEYLNLTACRGLPRGMKRLYANREAIEKLYKDILEGKFNENDDSDG